MRYTVLVAGLIVAVACVHTNAAVMDVTLKYAPLCPDGVKIFTDTIQIGESYQNVALLNSTGESGSTSEAGMIHSQPKKAAQLRANRLLLGRFKAPTSASTIIVALLGTRSQPHA